MVRKVMIGSDHAGFEVKEKLKKYLLSKKIDVEDVSENYKEGDDYPDYAFKVAEGVANERDMKGILVCGTGTGMIIAANKVKGIRAVEAYDEYSAKMSRTDNDTNILGLRERKFSFSKIKKIVDVWLKTEFSGEDRHKRRIKKIKEYEK